MNHVTPGILKGLLAAVGTILTFLFGVWDIAVIALVTFLVIDYLSGLAVAVANKNLSSSIGFRGLLKKALVLAVITVAVLVDRLISNGSDVWMFRTVVCYFYIANEGISIIENASRLGIPVPKKLLDILVQLRHTEDDGQ